MTITLPAIPITGTTIDSSWGVDVRNALSDLQSQVSAIPPGLKMEGADTTERSTVSTTVVTIATVTVSILHADKRGIIIEVPYQKNNGSTANLGIQINSTKMGPANGTTVTPASGTIGSGMLIARLSRRDTGYSYGGVRMDYSYRLYTDTASTTGTIPAVAEVPEADITSIVIYGLVSSGGTLKTKNVTVYSLPVA